MNTILQNRALRGFLTLFLGVMLTLSIGMAWQSTVPHPENSAYFDWYSTSAGSTWEATHPYPDGGTDAEVTKWEDQRMAAEQKAQQEWEKQHAGLGNDYNSWALETFAVLTLLGLAFVFVSLRFRDQLGILDGGAFLTGVLLLVDAGLLNFSFGAFSTGNGTMSLVPVVTGWLSLVAVFAMGWWRFVLNKMDDKDGQLFYVILTALAPVYVVGITVGKIFEKNPGDNNIGLWLCISYFVGAAVALGLGLTFSRKIGIMGNILTLSAVIMAFASVFSSLTLQELGVTAMVGFAAVAFAVLVARRTLARHNDSTMVIEPVDGVAVPTSVGDTKKVLVLYAADTPPADAVIVEVPVAPGLIYHGFGAYRDVPAVTTSEDAAEGDNPPS